MRTGTSTRSVACGWAPLSNRSKMRAGRAAGALRSNAASDVATSPRSAIHTIDQHGRPRSQRFQVGAIGRLPWREAEESCGRRGGLMGW